MEPFKIRVPKETDYVEELKNLLIRKTGTHFSKDDAIALAADKLSERIQREGIDHATDKIDAKKIENSMKKGSKFLTTRKS